MKSPWRRPIASLNYLLSSHVWRQDHNGFSHQDPGFIDHVVNKKAEVVRVYLPPDANCLLSVTDHCLRSRNYVNVGCGWQTACASVANDGSGDQALHRRSRHLGMGKQRPWQRARRGDGVLRRCADSGDSRRRRYPSPARPGVEDPGHQRRQSDEIAARQRASTWTARQGFRRSIHGEQTYHLCVSRVPVAHSSTDLPANWPCESARAWL